MGSSALRQTWLHLNPCQHSTLSFGHSEIRHWHSHGFFHFDEPPQNRILEVVQGKADVSRSTRFFTILKHITRSKYTLRYSNE